MIVELDAHILPSQCDLNLIPIEWLDCAGTDPYPHRAIGRSPPSSQVVLLAKTTYHYLILFSLVAAKRRSR